MPELKAQKEDIKLRQKMPGDTAIVHAIYNQAYRDAVERQFGPWNQAEQDVFFKDAWDKQEAQVITYGGVVCGFVVITNQPDSIFVYEIILSPDFQGKGIGTSILRELQNKATTHNRTVTLEVFLNNTDAKRLYERLGFAVTGSSSTHYQMQWTPKQ